MTEYSLMVSMPRQVFELVLVDHVEEGREGRATCMLRSVVRVNNISGLPADVSPPEATPSS